MSVFGKSATPKVNSHLEDRVVELMAKGYTQDQALDIAEGYAQED